MPLSPSSACSGTTFAPSLFGAEILSVEANLVTNYTTSIPAAFRYFAPDASLSGATFCNVTVSYTHPGQDDNIAVETWLPLEEEWNGRLQAVGGGGWVAGRDEVTKAGMGGALSDGFAAVSTDAGLGDAREPGPWALLSPGNINWYNLQNLASVSLNDMAVIAKSLVKSFYGQPPSYSYWTGCSQGGRQGLMLAQRYPDAFDGIAAGAPAIHWTDFLPSVQWPQQFMNEQGQYPYGCELDAITSTAVSVCDGLDGVVDGVITLVDECLATFDPFSVVGTSVNCTQLNGKNVAITDAAAALANATWHGMTTADGRQSWYGLPIGADLTGGSPTSYGQPGVASTNCTADGCVGAPNELGLDWLRLFVARDPEADFSGLSRREFDALVHANRQEYGSVVGTADPDLSRFRDAGGKMVTFHGLADNIIPPGGTEQYYNAVTALLPDVQDFYRYFEVPALGHCFGGPSSQPSGLFRQLQDWVENGTAPGDTPVEVSPPSGGTHARILCAYPQRAAFSEACGDPAAAKCWSCEAAGRGERPSLPAAALTPGELRLSRRFCSERGG